MLFTATAASDGLLPTTILMWLLVLLNVCIRIGLPVLLILALVKYLRGKKAQTRDAELKRSLGEVLKDRRTKCAMTQEFVAESLGVTRQAVSRWENGTADPTTANLLKLAKLYGIPPEELIASIAPEE